MSAPSASFPLLETIDKARAGNEDARNRLFQKCRSYLDLLAKVEVGSRLRVKADTSDLVQNTLMDAYRGLDDFRGRTQQEWLGWLKQILKRNMTDLIRHYRYAEKRRIDKEVPLDRPQQNRSTIIGFEPPADVPTPSQVVIALEDEFLLAEAIALLPEDYSQVIVLRNLQRLSFEEVAREMNRTRPAAQMLWLRAVRKLGESMNNQSHE